MLGPLRQNEQLAGQQHSKHVLHWCRPFPAGVSADKLPKARIQQVAAVAFNLLAAHTGHKCLSGDLCVRGWALVSSDT